MKQALIFAVPSLAMLSACVPAGDAPVSASTATPAAAQTANQASAQASLPSPRPAPQPIALPRLEQFALKDVPRQGGRLRGVLPSGVESLKINGVPVALAEDRGWMAAFDRDAPAQALMIARMADGREAQFPLHVAAGDWRIERVNIPMRGAARTSEEFQRRRAAELDQIAKARAVEVQSDGWRQQFIWPVTGRFSGFFGSQRIYQGVAGSYHGGNDIAAPRGTPFVAPADGVVVLAASSPFTLEGNLLIISHGKGLNSAFLHCDRLDVKLGDVVKQGQHLGTVGSTGRSTGPHMHWGMKWGDYRVDSASFVKD